MTVLRVGIDLDGVCFDFAESVRRYIRKAGLESKYRIGRGETSCWNFFYDWGMTLEEFLKVCNDGADAGYIFEGGVRDNADEEIRRIKALGHEIHIVTDRKFGKTPEVSETITRSWLRNHNIPYDSLTFSADKTCVPTDLFIEDKLENYDALDAADTEVYLVNRPWNAVEDDDRRRITSISSYREIINFYTVYGWKPVAISG